MDILAARKKAAERAKKKEETPLQPAAEVTEQRDVPQAAPATAGPDEVPAETEAPAPLALEAAPAEEVECGPAPELEEEAAEPVIEELETLAFRLGSEGYLVMVDEVKEVLKMRDLTPVPHAPEYVPGVISLRGTVLPVIDLAKRLGLAPGARDEKSRIIVVGIDDEDAGLIVDRVTSVVRFLPDAIQPAPETVAQGAGAEYLKGIVRKDGKLYILLDLAKAAGK